MGKSRVTVSEQAKRGVLRRNNLSLKTAAQREEKLPKRDRDRKPQTGAGTGAGCKEKEKLPNATVCENSGVREC